MLETIRQNKRNHSNNFRVLKEFDNHEMVIGLSDERVGLRGYIAIHNTNLGPALGGTRLQHYSSEQAALKDVLNLSKAMSYKCALASLPWGGGKAVLFNDTRLDKDKQLKSYARLVEKLNGLFKTGTDLGVLDDDVKKMAKYTSHMLGVSPANRGGMTTSHAAALGVYFCIKNSLAYANNNDSLAGKIVGIKGVGKLGGELARLLYQEGASLVIADTDKTKTQALEKKYPGLKVVDHREIHRQQLDIYSPCATGRDISPHVVKELKAKIVAGGANNQLTSDKEGDKLFKKGILYAPDYITNAGGLIYVADELEPGGFKKSRVLKRTRGISKTLNEVFVMSQREKVGTHRISDQIAIERIKKAAANA